jgi:DNA-binding transcriptional ArsR family regulator
VKADEALDIKNAAVASVAQALASPVRLRILGVLEQGEHSVDALAAKVEQSRANTSAQLKVLSAAGLLESRREGRRVYYRIASEPVRQLFRALQATAADRSAELRELLHTYYELPDRLDRRRARELLRQVRAGDVVLLDLRPADEHAAGHPRGALNVPLEELRQRLAEIPADREVVAYCRGRYCVLAVEGVERLRAAGRPARNLGAPPRELARLGFPWEAAPSS